MKRTLAWLCIAALLLVCLPTASFAAEEGEMLLTSEPVQGAVGEIVKVDFYCYPNIPEGTLLDSLQGTLAYDPELLTLGSINLRDDDQNLNSLLNSKSPLWMHTEESGKVFFAYADAFGTDVQGFLFQIEFRIEKEGACAFVINNLSDSCVDGSTNKSGGSFFLNPLQVGGVYTEGYEVPSDAAAGATFKPMDPAVQTPQPAVTPTPLPSNGGQSVPHTSTLPQPTNLPTPHESGIVTPNPPVTSMPMNTPNGSTQTAAPATEVPQTEAPVDTDGPVAHGENEVAPDQSAEATDAPLIVAEVTEVPTETSAPVQPSATPAPTQPQQTNRALVIAVIAGIVVVILLAILAIVLILLRNKRMNQED